MSQVKFNICSLGDPTDPKTWSGTPFHLYSELKRMDYLALALKNIETNLYAAYEALLNKNIVCDKEMLTLESWLNDMQVINNQEKR